MRIIIKEGAALEGQKAPTASNNYFSLQVRLVSLVGWCRAEEEMAGKEMQCSVVVVMVIQSYKKKFRL